METIGTITAMVDTPERLEQRLRAGEWLRVGEVAVLLGAARATADRMVNRGLIGYRLKPGTGRHRECDPADVARLLAERRQRRVGGE